MEKALVASPLPCLVSRSSRLGPRLYEAVQAMKALTKGYHKYFSRKTLTFVISSRYNYFKIQNEF